MAAVDELSVRIGRIGTSDRPAAAAELDDIAASMRALVREHQPHLSWATTRRGLQAARKAAGIAAEVRGLCLGATGRGCTCTAAYLAQRDQ